MRKCPFPAPYPYRLLNPNQTWKINDHELITLTRPNKTLAPWAMSGHERVVLLQLIIPFVSFSGVDTMHLKMSFPLARKH